MTTQDITSASSLDFETAAGHLSTQVPITSPTTRIGDLRRSLDGRQFETAAQIAVCEGPRLQGLLSMESLLAARETALVRDLMDADPPVVAPHTDQEVVAWKAVQRGESCLAVVDEEGNFRGLIPPHRLLGVLLWEHDEDMARVGGYLRDVSSARTASEEPVPRRFWHRVPWLLVGLLGAFVSAGIMSSFEERLREMVVLAFFVPGIVYLADAVGTQTEALIIRGLSVGVPVGRVARREVLTGVLVGIVLAAAFFPVALWQWGDSRVALAVAISLFAACATATVIAMLLPWLFYRLGRDPAFGSGPLATVIQDILSILIYFLISFSLVLR
jgi:magnesium transporter